MFWFFVCYGDHRDLHGLSHSFPSRRSSDLATPRSKVARSKAARPRLDRAEAWLISGPTATRNLPPAPPSGSAAAWRSGTTIPLAISRRSEEHTSELQSLMRLSYAVFCVKKQTTPSTNIHPNSQVTST